MWVGATTDDDYVYGVYVMDLSTKTQNVLFKFTDPISNPKIYGDNIVYSLSQAGGMIVLTVSIFAVVIGSFLLMS